jgi:hypothetical protein
VSDTTDEISLVRTRYDSRVGVLRSAIYEDWNWYIGLLNGLQVHWDDFGEFGLYFMGFNQAGLFKFNGVEWSYGNGGVDKLCFFIFMSFY